MTMEIDINEIDYDKMVDDELSCLTDDIISEELPEDPPLETNVNACYSLDDILNKISENHENFYKSCYDNIVDDHIIESNRNSDLNSSNKTIKITDSLALTYEDFIKTLSNLEKTSDDENVLVASDTLDFQKRDSSIHALIDHEAVLQKINEEKWNEYDKFFLKFDERCQSARSVSRREFQEENMVEDTKRKILQATLNEQLKNLTSNMEKDETENKVRLMELEEEIEQEKLILMKLKKQSNEILSEKEAWAAIMIQKTFRRYRIRKRIGSQIDAAREAAKRKLFNTKLIINEKEAQRQKAAKLRKWRKEQEMNKKEQEMNQKSITTNNKIVDDKTNSTSQSNKMKSKVPSIINEDTSHLKNDSIVDTVDEPDIKFKTNSNDNVKREESVIEILETQTKNRFKIEINTCHDDYQLIGDSVCSNDKNENQDKNISKRNDSGLNTNILVADITIKQNQEILSKESYIEDGKTTNDKNEFISMQNNNNNLDSFLSESLDPCITDTCQSINCHDFKLTCVMNPDVQNSRNAFSPIQEIVEINSACSDSTIIDVKNSNIKNIIESESQNDNKIWKIVERTETCGSKNMSVNYQNSNSDVNDKCDPDSIVLEDTTRGSDKTKELKEVNIILHNESATSTDVKNIQPDSILNIEFDKKSNDLNICKDSVVESLDSISLKNTKNSDIDTRLETKKNNNDQMASEPCHLKSNFEALKINEESKAEFDQVKNDIKLCNSKSFQDTNQDKSDCNQKEKSCIINEKYLQSHFRNRKVLSACILWMQQNSDKNEISKNLISCNEINNDNKQLLPVIPKHYIDHSNLTDKVGSNINNSVIAEPVGTSPRSCNSLSIIDSNLDSINEIKLQFPVLEYLTLNRNPLKYFQLADMPEFVKYVDINANKLEWVYFGNTVETYLTVLSCTSNELSSLPINAFRNCHNILHIDFSNNNFLTIESLFKGNKPITSLCSLNLNNNVLSDIGNLHIFCPNLTHLSISGNHLNAWSSTLHFPFLVDCDVSHNSISSLQFGMNTPLLVHLDISHNGISDLDSFSHSWLPCLSNLVLDSNKLENMPDLNLISLQNLSIETNYLRDPINFERIFQNCPLLLSINMKNNMNSETLKTRDLDHNVIRYGSNPDSSIPIICPEGEFQTACFDFADIIKQKSIKFNNALRSASCVELKYKHRVHYYRCTRETAIEFYSWMYDFLFRIASPSVVSNELIYSQEHVKAVLKIQTVWRGYRIRKWYKIILSRIKFDSGNDFEDFPSVDVSEYDESYLCNNWSPSVEIGYPKNAWTPNLQTMDNDIHEMPVNEFKNDEIIISGNESSCGSHSTRILNKKGLEIMKEWGFEDPNSALWMLERAKRFQNKPIKTTKISKPPIPQYSQPRTQNILYSDCKKSQTQQRNIFEAASISTVTIPSPCNTHITSYRSKVDDWFHENSFVPNSCQTRNSEKKSFLPAIDSDNQLKKIPSVYVRSESSRTRLPSINYVP